MFHGMEYVYEVYKERSFSKAASNLFISQPSLSANVKRIEKRIGYPIFDRSTKPLGITECGQRYIQSVMQIRFVENEFTDFINNWGDLKTGSLTLGGSSFFSSWVLPSLIGEFSRKYPQIKIMLVEKDTVKLAELLQSGDLDFMLDNCELDDNVFDRSVFREEYLLLAVPRSFAVNEELIDYQIPIGKIREGAFLGNEFRAVLMNAFVGLPFIMMKPDNDTGKRALAICQENHFQPQIAFELDQQMTSYNITCSGMGISFIGDMLISRVPNNPDVVYYKLPGSGGRRNIYFYWKKGRYLSRVMEEYLRQVNLPPR